MIFQLCLRKNECEPSSRLETPDPWWAVEPTDYYYYYYKKIKFNEEMAKLVSIVT